MSSTTRAQPNNNMSKFGLSIPNLEKESAPHFVLDGISLLHTLLAKELTLKPTPPFTSPY
jgi:hypothetical protein